MFTGWSGCSLVGPVDRLVFSLTEVIRHVGPMTPLGGLGELEAEGAQRSGASRTGRRHHCL